MPYLSHDWERGERRLVSDRLNLMLKLTAIGMLAASVLILLGAPLLFHVAFEGKYDEGLAVLPWTLTYCVWYAILIIAQNYLWCAEKTKLGSLPLGIGLAANIAAQPGAAADLGTHGAVFATTLSTGLALGLLYWLNRREGMELHSGLLWLSFAPIALGGGAWLGAAVLVAILIAAPFSRTLFNDRRTRDAGRHTSAISSTRSTALLDARQPEASRKPDDCTHSADRTAELHRRSTASRKIAPLELPRPLRVMFLMTSMPVGGAETLLAELVRRLDREPFPAGNLLPEGARPARRRCWPARFRCITTCSRTSTTCASGRG